MIATKTVGLKDHDQIFAKLVELGVSEKWLSEANISLHEAVDLFKGVLYLREIYPNRFSHQ